MHTEIRTWESAGLLAWAASPTDKEFLLVRAIKHQPNGKLLRRTTKDAIGRVVYHWRLRQRYERRCCPFGDGGDDEPLGLREPFWRAGHWLQCEPDEYGESERVWLPERKPIRFAPHPTAPEDWQRFPAKVMSNNLIRHTYYVSRVSVVNRDGISAAACRAAGCYGNQRTTPQEQWRRHWHAQHKPHVVWGWGLWLKKGK